VIGGQCELVACRDVAVLLVSCGDEADMAASVHGGRLLLDAALLGPAVVLAAAGRDAYPHTRRALAAGGGLGQIVGAIGRRQTRRGGCQRLHARVFGSTGGLAHLMRRLQGRHHRAAGRHRDAALLVTVFADVLAGVLGRRDADFFGDDGNIALRRQHMAAGLGIGLVGADVAIIVFRVIAVTFRDTG